MYKERLNKIISKMDEDKIDYLLISDNISIYYLSGILLDPYERFFALLIDRKLGGTLFLNDLFVINKQDEYKEVRYSDLDDPIDVLSKYIEDEKVIGIDKNLRSEFLLKLIENYKNSSYINGSYIVDNVRMIKDKKEQALMKESSKLNDLVMEEIIKELKDGITELELHAKIIKSYKEHGAEDVSFSPIVAFGENAANPHHESDDTVLKCGDCVLLDIGCLKNGYCSDMTRTVFYKEVSDKSKEVYEIVKEANKRGILAAKPGARFCDVDRAAREYIEEMGYGEYFNHRTGHCIGLTDHEFGDVSQNNEKKLESGMIFSVEPGIYLKDEVGVRIEDLVLITDDKNEVLNNVTKEVIVVD